MDGFILQIPVTGDEYETVLASVSSCRVTKRHRLGGLNDRHLCLDNSGGRTSESMCRQGCFLPGPLSLACRWPSSACVFPWFPLCVSVSPSLLLIRTLVISLPAEQARVGVVRNEEREFWGSGGHRQPVVIALTQVIGTHDVVTVSWNWEEGFCRVARFLSLCPSRRSLLSNVRFLLLVFLELPLFLAMLGAVLWVNRPQSSAGRWSQPAHETR